MEKKGINAYQQFFADATPINTRCDQFLAGKEIAPELAIGHSVAKNLMHFRENRGFTLAEAQQITKTNLAQFEAGEAVPTLAEVSKIAELYGVQPHLIIAGITEETVVPASCYGLQSNKNWYTIRTLLDLHESGIAEANPFFKSDMTSVIRLLSEMKSELATEKIVAA